MFRRHHIVGISLILTAVGCGWLSKKDNADEGNSANCSDETKCERYEYPFKFKSNYQSTSKEQTVLIEALNAKLSVHGQWIGQAILGEHAKPFTAKSGKSLEETSQSSKELLQNVKPAENPHDLKIQVEESQKAKFKTPAKYNIKANTIFDVLIDNKLQCYSGTMTHQLTWSQLDSYRQSEPVVIYQKGHVLSGYMIREKDDWRLVGVETTVIGKGKVNFGLTKDLNVPLRVVTGKDFLLLESIKNQLDNAPEIAKLMQKKSAEKYAINLEKIEALIAAKFPTDAKDVSFELNRSPLAFGSADVTEGDKDRATRDEVDPNSSGALIFSANNESNFQSSRLAPDAPIEDIDSAVPEDFDFACQMEGFFPMKVGERTVCTDIGIAALGFGFSKPYRLKGSNWQEMLNSSYNCSKAKLTTFFGYGGRTSEIHDLLLKTLICGGKCSGFEFVMSELDVRIFNSGVDALKYGILNRIRIPGYFYLKGSSTTGRGIVYDQNGKTILGLSEAELVRTPLYSICIYNGGHS